MADRAVPDGALTRRFREHSDGLGVYHAEVVELVEEEAEPAIKFARINASTDGDNVVIATVTGKKLQILGYCWSADLAGLVTIKDSAAGVKAEFDVSTAAIGLPFSYAGGTDAPAFETAVTEGLLFNVQVGQDVTGHLCYREIT